MLKFYNREKESALLEEIEQRSQCWSQMTFVVGRRRVGKTALLNRVYKEKKTLYFIHHNISTYLSNNIFL
jgi:AAA+ ATPase superfamily predicted ATPase